MEPAPAPVPAPIPAHGLLHQLGFDDLQPEQARRMHREEDAILQDAGYGKVYDSTRKG